MSTDIDDYGRLDEQIKRLERRIAPIKDRLLAELGNGEHIGEAYVVSIVGKVQTRLDGKLFKRECPNVYDQYVKECPYREVSTRRITT